MIGRVVLGRTSGRPRGRWARAAFHVSRLLLRSPRDVRYAPRLARSLASDASPLADGQPWMPYRAIDWLDRTVDRSTAVFEYGSGGGTLFLAQRAGELHSVEHD